MMLRQPICCASLCAQQDHCCAQSQSLVDAKPEQIVEVVTTNLLGSLLATRAAIQVMGEQATAGHIFNVDGAGADGAPTPQYAAYGATKAGAHTTPSPAWKACR
jgi:chlorophyll(ide) b reductase